MANQFEQEIRLNMKHSGFKQTKKRVEEAKNSITNLADAQKKSEDNAKELRTAMLGMGLSFLFTGMAIKKWADTLLKDVFGTFSKIMGEGTKFNEQTNRLRATFDFLKFSIVDALSNSEMFATLVDFVVGLVNGISEFISKHPEVGKFIIIFLVLASVIGGLMMLFGQTVLFMLGAMFGFGLVFSKITGAIAVRWAVMTGFMSKVWKGFLVWARANTITLGLGMAAVFAFIFYSWQKKLGGMKNFAAVVVLGIMSFFLLLGGNIISVFETMLERVVGIINTIVRAYNSIARVVGAPLLGEISFEKSGLGGRGLADMFLGKVRGGGFGGFLQGGLESMIDAKDQFGTGGFLNPFETGDNFTDLQAPEGFKIGGDLTQTFNVQNTPAFNIDLDVEGLSPEAQERMASAVIATLEEEGFLTGGSPQN